MVGGRRLGLTRSQVVCFLALLGGGLVLAAQILSRWNYARWNDPDVAAEAKDYLRQRNVKKLDIPLAALLANAATDAVPTLQHPLLDKAAPEFCLSDCAGQQHLLSDHLTRGPVVVVFYYGYYCNHCVSQLFALNDDISKFRELGADVLAISADTPQETAEKFVKFGKFDFPVLSDPGNKAAAAFSIYARASANQPERLLHATFVIDKDGVVRWCHYGEAPFTANATLLVELGKVQGRVAGAPKGEATKVEPQ